MHASDPIYGCHADAPIQSDKVRLPAVPEDAAMFARRLPQIGDITANSFYLGQIVNANPFQAFQHWLQRGRGRCVKDEKRDSAPPERPFGPRVAGDSPAIVVARTTLASEP